MKETHCLVCNRPLDLPSEMAAGRCQKCFEKGLSTGCDVPDTNVGDIERAYCAGYINGAAVNGSVIGSMADGKLQEAWARYTKSAFMGQETAAAPTKEGAEIPIPEEIMQWIDGQISEKDEYDNAQSVGKELMGAMYRKMQEEYNKGANLHMYGDDLSELQSALSSMTKERDDALDIISGYREWGEDIKRLCKQIGDSLDGDKAALQPSLCDLVGPVQELVKEANEYRKALERYADPAYIRQYIIHQTNSKSFPSNAVSSYARLILNKYTKTKDNG